MHKGATQQKDSFRASQPAVPGLILGVPTWWGGNQLNPTSAKQSSAKS